MKTVVKGERGYTSMCEQDGVLYIALSRSLMAGKQTKLPTGLSDTSRNRLKVAKLQIVIDGDIDRNDFDTTLDRYRPKHKRKAEIIKLKLAEAQLSSLYEEYIETIGKKASPSTVEETYNETLRKLKLCPHQAILDVRKISNWLESNYTLDSTRRVLVQINACLKWAVGINRIPSITNPYPTAIKAVSASKKKRKAIEYYSTEDRDLIIEYGYNHPQIDYLPYSQLLELLFLVGMRWSEAIALTSDDWNGNVLTISKSVVNSEKGLILKQGLKREESRKVNVTPRAKELLDTIVSQRPEGLLFTPLRDCGKQYVRDRNFLRSFVTPLLEYINENVREIPIYTLYACRRTFITLALKSGYKVEDVAYLCGNSPVVIYNNYAGITKDLELRDF